MTADYSTTKALQERFSKAAAKLKDLAPSLAMAKTVKTYDSDRRKKLLAECVVDAFKDGAESTSEAEHAARASQAYQAGLIVLQNELKAAEEIICEYDAEYAAWDTCRSLLAVQRETMRQLE